jgi:drug/metabolite transporter (DMT)-like permease
MKLAAAIVTTTACLAAAVVVFFFMMPAMNGYHESDATWGMGAYILLAFVVSVIVGGLSWLLVDKLVARGFNSAVSLVIAVPVFTVIGIGLEIVCCIIGILISEFVRTHH